MSRLSLVSVSYSSLRSLGLLQWLLFLWSTGSGLMGFRSCAQILVAAPPPPPQARGCGIFPNQGWNLCSLHWKADSYPLYQWGSPSKLLIPDEWLFFLHQIILCDTSSVSYNLTQFWYSAWRYYQLLGEGLSPTRLCNPTSNDNHKSRLFRVLLTDELRLPPHSGSIHFLQQLRELEKTVDSLLTSGL